ncbi:hypothetical protein LV476_10510 [Guyparkeria hydrothermalis]|uniref:hypothetical protein n=1 Tax=Guyparkeria hydrothermalis TaxID=923 RepID=UPI00201FE3BD|nr:hypothetical protein [Guyparkeria hydrothermalis]MCL7745367.1 hypothetical protein [Guyparkeria hydrothermalis]
MGLRVDREAALSWLGIEGYRPSGRVPLPAGRRGVDAVELDAHPAAYADELPVDAGPGIDPVESADAPAQPVAADTPASTRPAVAPQAAAAAIQPESTGKESVQQESPAASPADGLSVAAGSPHRALAEAIGRVAGLACETGEGDRLTLAGETWELSTLAGDGQAKRRLWRALAARSRRSRT